MKNIRELLRKRILFFDGAMGTMLQKAGLKSGELPELLNLTQPELITGIHRAYLAAGADVITSNTFGANRFKQKDVGGIIAAALRNARAAAQEYDAFVALDIGPSGKLLAPWGDLEFEDAYEGRERQRGPDYY